MKTTISKKADAFIRQLRRRGRVPTAASGSVTERKVALGRTWGPRNHPPRILKGKPW